MRVSLQDGARLLARGLRTSSAAVAGLGAAILALVAIRAIEGRELPARYRIELRAGESIRVAVTRPTEPGDR